VGTAGGFGVASGDGIKGTVVDESTAGGCVFSSGDAGFKGTIVDESTAGGFSFLSGAGFEDFPSFYP
jgi:hypothetical protein